MAEYCGHLCDIYRHVRFLGIIARLQSQLTEYLYDAGRLQQ